MASHSGCRFGWGVGKLSTKESLVVKRILAFLNGLEGCYARKVHGGAYGTNGEPDIDGCRYGRAFKFEVKAPGRENMLTPLQVRALQRWEDAGAIVGMVVCVEDVKKLLDID